MAIHQIWFVQRLLKLAISLNTLAFLTACADVPYSPSALVPPAKRCMVAPAALARLSEGDDLVPAYASLVRSYGNETSKLRCLQRWVRTVKGD